MRGAHRDVWCSKVTPLIEAELFAAESCRPALSGRALLCAAPYAREIQGSKASKNLPDARNRAPVPPFSRASSMRRLKGRSGESRGDRKPCLVSCPLLPSAVGTASPPPKAANAHALRGRNLASSGASPDRRNRLPSSDGKAEGALIACGGRPPDRRNRLPSADGKEKKDLC